MNLNPSITPFNSPIEIGLRLLSLLTVSFPSKYSIQQLAAFDYMVVHSDDLPGGPSGIHPRTPQRSSEYLIRLNEIHKSLLFYMSRNLVEEFFTPDGITYSATNYSASFLDTLKAKYSLLIWQRASWVIEHYGDLNISQLNRFMIDALDEWGGENRSNSSTLEEDINE